MKIFEILDRENTIDDGRRPERPELDEIGDELEQQEEEQQPRVHNLAVKSSWIAGLSYDEGSQIATMVLNTGQSYDMDVPMSKQTFSEWYNAPSKGKFFHSDIKNVYIY